MCSQLITMLYEVSAHADIPTGSSFQQLCQKSVCSSLYLYKDIFCTIKIEISCGTLLYHVIEVEKVMGVPELLEKKETVPLCSMVLWKGGWCRRRYGSSKHVLYPLSSVGWVASVAALIYQSFYLIISISSKSRSHYYDPTVRAKNLIFQILNFENRTIIKGDTTIFFRKPR